jgi:hypothetical protein
MKKIFFFSVIVIAVTTFNSCKKESSEKANSRFVGTYSGNMVCGTTPSNQSVPVEANAADDSKLFIYFDTYPMDAVVSGNSFTIPNQTLYDPTNGGLTVAGSGTISSNIMTMTFNVYLHNSGQSGVCTFNGSK